MGSKEYARGRRVVARLAHGGDLLQEIAAVADAHGTAAAEVRATGAPSEARLAFNDQQARVDGDFAVDGPVELVSLLGNVSRRDGATMVHVHATLAGHDCACVGGHVAPGCRVSARDLMLEALEGDPLEREYDEVRGLPLWRGL